MLAHTSDNPRFFGRYSTLVFLMLLGLAIGTVAGFVGSVILQRDPRHVEQIERHLVKWRTKAWFAPLGLTAACSLLILLWFFFLGDHLETYVVLRLFLGFTILLTTLGVIMGGDTSGTGVKINYLVLGTIGLIFVAAVIVGNFYPVYHPDETLIMGMLRNFADTGNAGPLLYRFTTPTNYIGRGLWIWIMSNWLNLVGFSQTTARLYTLLVGYAALPFIWGTAARLYNRSVAWLAVMLSAFGIALFNYIRPDTSTILLFSIALYCYVLGRNNNRLWLHLLTGLFVSLAVDSEPIAFTFGLGFFGVYFLDYLKQIRNHRHGLWWRIT